MARVPGLCARRGLAPGLDRAGRMGPAIRAARHGRYDPRAWNRGLDIVAGPTRRNCRPSVSRNRRISQEPGRHERRPTTVAAPFPGRQPPGHNPMRVQCAARGSNSEPYQSAPATVALPPARRTLDKDHRSAVPAPSSCRRYPRQRPRPPKSAVTVGHRPGLASTPRRHDEGGVDSLRPKTANCRSRPLWRTGRDDPGTSLDLRRRPP